MKSQTTIQAVSFDVGGTLIEPWPSVGHIYAEVAAKHGFAQLAPETLNAAFKQAWKSCKNFDYTRSGWESLVQQTFGESVHSLPFFPELYERFTEADAWHVFDDVLPTLETLASEQVRLIVISNWDERLRLLLQRLRLYSYFETLVISCEVGFSKPSPVIFEHAAAKLGLPPQAILHVGDSAEMDLRGACAAGFEAVHLRRGAKNLQSSEIASLLELKDVSGNFCTGML
jgi:haloacid dehalogenase superfamily, subfamily IA, variant 3 with third motif having DD or ED/haloacid dehalogenase superfamily, subfamily IA, variant 1 with third motif having Dx(3-4)D or Dx(3-4)E/REG-2-like, HAD superfamily (subfamily IA) hydrolase